MSAPEPRKYPDCDDILYFKVDGCSVVYLSAFRQSVFMLDGEI